MHQFTKEGVSAVRIWLSWLLTYSLLYFFSTTSSMMYARRSSAVEHQCEREVRHFLRQTVVALDGDQLAFDRHLDENGNQ